VSGRNLVKHWGEISGFGALWREAICVPARARSARPFHAPQRRRAAAALGRAFDASRATKRAQDACPVTRMSLKRYIAHVIVAAHWL
jgi:hypothetical protein